MAEYNAEEQLKEVRALKQQEKEASALTVNVSQEIQTQYENNAQQLAKTDEFKNLTKEITKRKAQVILENDMLEVMSEEHRLALSKYVLDCEKEQLDFRKKKGKKLIIEEVKADIMAKKITALKKRFSHLYEKDANGEPINFIPSKSYNLSKEFSNWWNGQSNNFRKYVAGTLKFIFFGAVTVLAVIVGYNIFEFISDASSTIN